MKLITHSKEKNIKEYSNREDIDKELKGDNRKKIQL